LGGESRQFNELHWHTACIDRDGVRSEWTLKIEKDSQGGKTTIRLIGHFQSEHVGELKKQLQDNGPQLVLDLKEVMVVDVDVIRFLGACKADGVKIVRCSPYIRKWMAQERKPEE
jgi:hypothetical protein